MIGQRPPVQTGDAPSRIQVFDLQMSGLPGTLCQTTFELDSNRSEPIKVKFNYSMLIDATGEYALDVPIRFNPPVAKLEHRVTKGDRCRVGVAAGCERWSLPHLLNMEGMPGLQYRLWVIVEKPLPGKKASETQKLTTKKTSKKNSGQRLIGRNTLPGNKWGPSEMQCR